MQRFTAPLTGRANLPLPVHGADPDQAETMWAAHRASIGVPPAIALLDGGNGGAEREP